MKIKRILLTICLLVLVCCMQFFTGCKKAGPEPDTDDTQQNSTIHIVTTIFPLYDFARAVCGDGSQYIHADITMLLSPGMETHSYEPTPQDMIKIQDCDLFLYIGGESDAWVEDLLSSMDHPVHTLRLMDAVDLLEEEGEEEEETEYDEHIWTSPANAVKMMEAIRDEICALVNIRQAQQGVESYVPISDMYAANADAYIDAIRELDGEFRTFFDSVSNQTLFFGDRFPFLYFVKEYGLSYYAAFPGCYEGSEPSAADITKLVDEAKTLSVDTIYYIEFSNHQIADVIAESTGASTAMIHSCHNVSKEDFDNQITYLELMHYNLETFKGSMK